MSRSELGQLLNLLVSQGIVTVSDAHSVLAMFDAGTLDANQLPLPLIETLTSDDDEHRAALLAVAFLLSAFYGSRLLIGQRGIPLAKRARVRDALRTAFELRTGRLAKKLVRSGNVRAWHGDMAKAVRDHILQQHIAGIARPLRAMELFAVQETMREQMDYLYRFAGHMAVRLATGLAVTAAYVWNRAVLYVGAGWDAYWRGAEVAQTDNSGWIVHYRSRDDNGTCSPCRSAGARSPYRAGGNHPYPGSACLGAGHCRCTLDFEYDPAVYRRLAA